MQVMSMEQLTRHVDKMTARKETITQQVSRALEALRGENPDVRLISLDRGDYMSRVPHFIPTVSWRSNHEPDQKQDTDFDGDVMSVEVRPLGSIAGYLASSFEEGTPQSDIVDAAFMLGVVAAANGHVAIPEFVSAVENSDTNS